MRTFKVTLTEEELKAVISFNTSSHYNNYSVERSSRIHELTKKLNKSVEVEDKVEEQQTEEQAKNNANAVDGWG